MSSTVLKPRMSEKTYGLSGQRVFVFIVDGSLNKHQIADLVAKTYDVSVINVRIVVQKGKTTRLWKKRRAENGVRADIKKAYVTLKEGDSIPIFAAVEEAEAKAEEADKKAEKKTRRAKKEEK